MKKKKSMSPKKSKPSKRKEKAERMKTIMEVTGKSKKTIQNASWLASRISPQIREYADKVSMKHFAAVATLHPNNQKQVLELAIQEKWTAEQTARAVRGMKLGEDRFLLDQVERMKSEFKKLADMYRDWSILEDVIKAIDEFVAREFEITPPAPPTTPPTTHEPPTEQ